MWLCLEAPQALHFGAAVFPADLQLVVDDGQVFHNPLLERFPVPWRARFSLLAREVNASLDLAHRDSMPLAVFLCCLWGMSVVSLVKQVLGQLSVMLDEIWLERQVSQNPLDIEEDELSIPKSARSDVALSDKFVLGEGCGAGGARVKHPAQHMQSFRMFLPSAKRPCQIDFRDANEDLLLRYVQIQEHIFPLVRHPSVASDGVRVSGKDAVYLCIGGFHLEAFRAAWGLMAPCGYCTQSQADLAP